MERETIDREQLNELIHKYSGSGPRYTSYPTAVEFHSAVNESSWKEHLAQEFRDAGRDDALSLYVHIPFCRSLCYFCACHKLIVTDRVIVRPYLTALSREFAQYRKLLPDGSAVRQLHWGGGSPSFLTPDEAAALFRSIADLVPIDFNHGDISIELDPRTTDREKMSLYRSLGFNRASFGVQDFNPAVQKAVNRIQTFESTAELIAAARAEGFESLNVDLIYGLPEQQPESFAATIESVLALKPDRVALYGYAHVTWLKKTQKSFERFHLPSPEERIALFLTALEAFERHGYRHIGMDHFALPGDSLTQAAENGTLHRSFMGYTTHRGARLLALGASAISTVPGMLAQNQRDVALYTRAASEGRIPIERGVERRAEDQLRSELIDALFCSGRIEIAAVERRWQIQFWDQFHELQPALKEFQADGLVSVDLSALQVTATGRLFVRNIAMLFDEYLARRSAGEKQVFSATV